MIRIGDEVTIIESLCGHKKLDIGIVRDIEPDYGNPLYIVYVKGRKRSSYYKPWVAYRKEEIRKKIEIDDWQGELE